MAKNAPATPLPQLGVDWKENSVSFYTMDGVILARSFNSTKGKLYEEIVRRTNAYERLVEALQEVGELLDEPNEGETPLQRAGNRINNLLRELGEL